MFADSEGSSGPEDAWLQQQQGGGGSASPGSPGDGQPSQPAVQREDWMTVPMARSFAGQPDNKQQEKKQHEKEVGVDAVLLCGCWCWLKAVAVVGNVSATRLVAPEVRFVGIPNSSLCSLNTLIHHAHCCSGGVVCCALQPEEAPIVSGIRYMKPEQAAAAGRHLQQYLQQAPAIPARCWL